MDYEIKIKNHQKFNKDDIRTFCITVARQNNLNDYVTELVFRKIWDGIAAYDKDEHIICVDDDFLEYYKDYKKAYKSKRLLDRILVLDADAFFRDYELPDFILEKLSDIASEKINTINIFEELFSGRERKV